MSGEPAREPETMDLPSFERRAAEMWERIPDSMREGVDALLIEKQAIEHPTLPGVFTLGECVTESWPTGYSDTGDVRSRLVLYHGSFASIARADAGFEWDAEVWETILHELLHHREAAAGESGLDDFDWAAEQNFLRHAGRPFDPEFPRSVPVDSDGIRRIDSEIFALGRREGGDGRVSFRWRGKEYGTRVPATDAPLFVAVRNLAGGRLWVVVPAQSPWWRKLLGRPSEPPAELSRRALPAPGV